MSATAATAMFPGDVNVQNVALLARDSAVSCHTRCESVVHCHSAPLSESGVRLLSVRRRTVNERAFFSSAKGVTLRESPLSLAKITKTCSSQTMSAAGDLSAAPQHLPDVER